MILMCKDSPVYDINDNMVLNENIIPGAMLKGMSYEKWKESRGFLLSNYTARQILFRVTLNRNRDEVLKSTHMLSLSDCYWTKEVNENIKFDDITPYKKKFWTDASEPYEGGALPTLYLNGAIDKYWLNSDWLFKNGCEQEVEAYELAKMLDVPCNEIKLHTDCDINGNEVKGIAIKNFTDIDKMLEPVNFSGKIDVNAVYADEKEVIDMFGYGLGNTMMCFDIIIGNTDRHTQNYGFIRNANTGEYSGMAPLYDFNCILGDEKAGRFLLDNVPKNDLMETMCLKTLEKSNHSVFRERAALILERHYMRTNYQTKQASSKAEYLGRINDKMAAEGKKSNERSKRSTNREER
ncbi:MAG: HipA domain-containing protein [Oscillospiraceae bacterium]|nr:HipA domain-containing protein [Oscillospiraceae bacterium]MCL2279875.1 HipA domain-containing protein [Oscillospiraceae bacterium]